MKVYVDGVLEIDISGSFNDGRLAFYNFSQAGVTYSGFSSVVTVVGVDIDIKPGDDANCINNNGHGVISVAILGSATFDVAQVDPSTVNLSGLEVSAKGKNNKLLANVEDVNGDGFPDLVVRMEDVGGAFASGSGTATLTGTLFDGTSIEGSDVVCVIP